MRIDQTHRTWLIGSTVTLAVASVGYGFYAAWSPAGPQGGSTVGILYGVVGSAMMLFAGLLGARKSVPIWRLGRAQSWMRGHLWLGVLTLPIILFHAGFHFGHGLTRGLVWLLLFVWLSGVFGAALQHFIPRMMTQQLPMETIYEQIERVRLQLCDEATRIVTECTSRLSGNLSQSAAGERALAAAAGTMGGNTVASALQMDSEGSAALTGFFQRELQPFLDGSAAKGHRLAKAASSRTAFRELRVLLPPSAEAFLDDLENICEEKRQLDWQRTMHHMLHGWLLVHVPASYALLLLGAIHAVAALRY